MKKSSFLLITLFIVTFSGYSQNSKNVATADEVGKYAFNVLKNLENTSKEQFKNNLLTIEELKEYVNKHSDSLEEFKEEMNKTDNASYQERVFKVYNEFKEKKKEFKIVWKDIEYSNFTYDEREEVGLKGIRAKLFFKYKENEYVVRIAAIHIKNAYYPLIIRRLRAVSK